MGVASLSTVPPDNALAKHYFLQAMDMIKKIRDDYALALQQNPSQKHQVLYDVMIL